MPDSNAEALVMRAAPNRAKVLAPSAPAAACVAGLEPGGAIEVLTKGQFSLLDLVRAVLEKTGPARVRLSTWSTGIRDAETAAWLLVDGAIESLQLFTDRSFPGRQPKYAARLVDLFGERAIVCTRVHAKVAIIEAPGWAVAIRSSMNLNRNPRFEQATIDATPEVVAFYGAWFDELAATAPTGFDWPSDEVERAFNAARGGGEETTRDAVEAMTGARPSIAKVRGATGAAPAASPGDLVGATAEEAAEWLLRQAQHGVESAEPGGVAYVQSIRAVRDAHRALMESREAAKPKGKEAADHTPEEWRAHIRADAAATSDQDLELYVHEWLERSGLRLMVDQGEPRLKRVS